jgi:WD40 repeat protein
MGAVRRTLEGHSDVVCAVAFSLDGKLVASASNDQMVRL